MTDGDRPRNTDRPDLSLVADVDDNDPVICRWCGFPWHAGDCGLHTCSRCGHHYRAPASDVIDCRCRCHETWRFVNQQPIAGGDAS